MLHNDDFCGDIVWKFRDPNDVDTFFYVMNDGDRYVPYFRSERIECSGLNFSWPTKAEAIKECLLRCGSVVSKRIRQAEEMLASARELQESMQEEWGIVAHLATHEGRELAKGSKS